MGFRLCLCLIRRSIGIVIGIVVAAIAGPVRKQILQRDQRARGHGYDMPRVRSRHERVQVRDLGLEHPGGESRVVRSGVRRAVLDLEGRDGRCVFRKGGAQQRDVGDGRRERARQPPAAARVDVHRVARAQSDGQVPVGEGVRDGAVHHHHPRAAADGVVAELGAVGGGDEAVGEFCVWRCHFVCVLRS